MSGHVAKEEIALLMPERLAHYFQDEPEYLPTSANNARGLFATIVDAVKWVIEMPRRRARVETDDRLTSRLCRRGTAHTSCRNPGCA